MSTTTSLSEDTTLGERIAANSRPALVWTVGFVVLIALEFGALARSITDPLPWEALYQAPANALGGGSTLTLAFGVVAFVVFLALTAYSFARGIRAESISWLAVGAVLTAIVAGLGTSAGTTATLAFAALSIIAALALFAIGVSRRSTPLIAVGFFALLAGLIGVNSWHQLPTLLNRNVIPNQGYHNPNTGWQNTFLGLSPAVAWAIRVVLVYLYVFVLLGWCWYGYQQFRRYYRYADWTPGDDMVGRFRNHYWGIFGLVVVVAFVTFALFAPAVSPTTKYQNIINPYSIQITYWNAAANAPAHISAGNANLGSTSTGTPSTNVGILQYDKYGRFHPFGTMVQGQDLFTFMAYGARVSLFIGLVSIGLSGIIATVLAMVTAYYKGLTDLLVVITSDSIQSLPQLLFVLLLSVVFAGTWIASIYSGGLLLALIFGATTWPFLWRAVRGPAFQIADQEWIDAARSFGQQPFTTMQKHMAPYIIGYLLVYASLTLGGVIISTAALSFLGLGVSPPTPEWGRAVDIGRQYISTTSWHISTIPGILVVIVVTAFNAFGDGIRDAIDPQSAGGGDAADEGAAASGGGG